MAVSADNQITWDIFDALPDPALALDGNREIIFANKAALGLLGEDIEGGDIAMALRQPLALSIANAALDGQNPEPGEIDIYRGTPQIFEVRAAPILGNRIVKALITFKDNTPVSYTHLTLPTNREV